MLTLSTMPFQRSCGNTASSCRKTFAGKGLAVAGRIFFAGHSAALMHPLHGAGRREPTFRGDREDTMTPQERKLIGELFDRLETLEDDPRDDGAVAAINEGLERAPNAMYPLVQTVLVQDEALKRVDARIRALEQELGV